MQTEDYKIVLLDTLKILAKAEIEMFEAMVNLGFSGEYTDISRQHEPGEMLNLEIEMFADTGDENLNQVTALVKEMMRTRISLMNLNAIDEEDLELD